MNNIKYYNNYINEGLFVKNINDYLEKIDQFIIKYNNNSSMDYFDESINNLYEISVLLNKIIMNKKNDINQILLNKIIKRYETVLNLLNNVGFITKNGNFQKIKKYLNSFIVNLNYIVEINNLVIDNKHINNELVYHINSKGYTFILTKEEKNKIDIMIKNKRKQHEDIDPHGEEDWNN